MRVTCQDIDEFLECLANEKDVYRDTIRVSIIKRPFDGTKRDAVKFEIILQASAVVTVKDEEQYLLEVGIYCGMDYLDGKAEEKGSEIAADKKQEIKGYANSRGWKILPGVIDA